MKTIITLTLIISGTITGLFGQIKGQETNEIPFYQGGISIENVSGKIAFKSDGTPDINLNLKIGGKKSNENSIGFRNGESSGIEGNEFNLKPNYSVSGSFGKTQSYKFDITPVINGLVPVNPVKNTQILIELPENFVFIRANQSVKTHKEGNKTMIALNLNNKYLTPLVLVFNTNGKGVSITKEIVGNTMKKGSVVFKIRLTNVGKTTLNDILVEDNFDSRDFQGKGSQFENYFGENNDMRTIWKHKIQTLKPGDTVELSYEVMVLNPVKDVTLDSARATDKDELIGVSNRIKL